eukprot:scaffold823_cov219-Amphora_coffeaeformis.AAC.10
MDDKRSTSVPREMEMGKNKGNTTTASGITKAKSSPSVVKKPESAPNKTRTQIAVRLNGAIQNNPKLSGRSQDVVPLTRDCERLIKHLQEFVAAARAYQRSMIDLESHRTNLFRKTETLARDTNLSEVVEPEASDMGRILQTLQAKVKSGGPKHARIYEDSIIDYAVEWKSILERMMESENSNAHQLHKTVQHYEVKVDKLRKQISDKDKKGGKSASPGQKDKLERNEDKLSKAWEEYDAASTRTANLLEEATKMGWNDFHPLAQAMIAFEQERGKDEQDIWDCVGTIQDQFVAVVSMHDNPVHSPGAISKEEKNDVPPIHALEDEIDSTEQTELIENPADYDETHEEVKAEC